MPEQPDISKALNDIMRTSDLTGSRALSCSITMDNIAKRMSDAEIIKMLPQLVEHSPAGAHFTRKVDFTGRDDKGKICEKSDGVVSNAEIRAAAILASKMAVEQGVTVDKIDLGSIDKKQAVKLTAQLLGQLPSPQSCAPPEKPQGREH